MRTAPITLLLRLAWISASLAQAPEVLNLLRIRSASSANAGEHSLLRVPIVLDGEPFEMTASALASAEERRAHLAAWAAERGVLDADVVERLEAALGAAALDAVIVAAARRAETEAALATAYADVAQRFKPVESDLADLRVGPSTVVLIITNQTYKQKLTLWSGPHSFKSYLLVLA